MARLLAKAPMQRYPHGRIDLLAAQLAALLYTDQADRDRRGVQHGWRPGRPACLLALAERFDAWLVIDDAHGFGVLGCQGRGALSHHRLCSERLIYMGTLGKAAGVAGAFVAAHPDRGRVADPGGAHYIYTTATPPAIAHAAAGQPAVDRRTGRRSATRAPVEVDPPAPTSAWNALSRTHAELGWTLADSATAIQPLIVR